MMSISYFRRILQAYLGPGASQLSFWHETPAVNEDAFLPDSRQYYMTFHDKAFYKGPFDAHGIPLLDYRGRIGRQYNPIAVAQYGLGCWNEYQRAGFRRQMADGRQQTTDDRQQTTDYRLQTTDYRPPTTDYRLPTTDHRLQTTDDRLPTTDYRLPTRAGFAKASPAREDKGENSGKWREKAIRCADWLVENLEKNDRGQWVWQHKFDWEYFRTLRAPWYSGLAQGMGLSLLVRIGGETGGEKYFEAADRAFETLSVRLDAGGTLHVDERGDWWIEEYITDPPTHILNGFMWALWGVRDYARMRNAECGMRKGERETRSKESGTNKTPQELWDTGVGNVERGTRSAELWEKGVKTLENSLERFDCGYWSLYDLSPVAMRNVASPFYHKLHIVQLDVMHRLTGRAVFKDFKDRWQGYEARMTCRMRALAAKAAFKLVHF